MISGNAAIMVTSGALSLTLVLRSGMQMTVRRSYAIMLLRCAMSADLAVSVTTKAEAPRAASSRIEREMVVSSVMASPREFRPAVSRRRPSGSRRKTQPRSAPVSRKVESTSVTRISSTTPVVFSLRAASRKNVSFSKSEAPPRTSIPEIWLRNSRAELVPAAVGLKTMQGPPRAPNSTRSLMFSL